MANTKTRKRYNQAQQDDLCKKGEQFVRQLGLKPVGFTYFDEYVEEFEAPAIEIRLSNGSYGEAWLACLKYVTQQPGGIVSAYCSPREHDSYTLFAMEYRRGILLYKDGRYIGLSLIQK